MHTNRLLLVHMHTNRLLLVEAGNANAAKRLVEEFLEPYGDGHVWDWYQFGGRWAWSTVIEENKDTIANQNDNYKSIHLDYEHERTVSTTAEQTEIINALDPRFWSFVQRGEDATYVDPFALDQMIISALPPERARYWNDKQIKKRPSKEAEKASLAFTKKDIRMAKDKIFAFFRETDLRKPKEQYNFMLPYYLRSQLRKQTEDSFDSDTCFFDISRHSKHIDEHRKTQIQENPQRFWLCNLDTHN